MYLEIGVVYRLCSSNLQINKTSFSDTETCPKLPSNTGVNHFCYRGNKEIDCSKPLFPDTKVRSVCKPHHQNKYVNISFSPQIICDKRGRWNASFPECEQGICCDTSRSDSITSRIRLYSFFNFLACGQYADNGRDFPWHVLISYIPQDSGYYYISGNILSPYLVLTGTWLYLIKRVTCIVPLFLRNKICIFDEVADWFTDTETGEKDTPSDYEVYVGNAANKDTRKKHKVPSK